MELVDARSLSDLNDVNESGRRLNHRRKPQVVPRGSAQYTQLECGLHLWDEDTDERGESAEPRDLVATSITSVDTHPRRGTGYGRLGKQLQPFLDGVERSVLVVDGYRVLEVGDKGVGPESCRLCKEVGSIAGDEHAASRDGRRPKPGQRGDISHGPHPLRCPLFHAGR